MELWIVLVGLYLLQCCLWLPWGTVLFVRAASSWLTTAGPGWRMLHPLPSGPGRVGTRLPLSEREGRLHGPGAASWLSGSGWHEFGPAVEARALAEAEARGHVVRVSGRPFARATGPEQAEAQAEFLRALGRAEDHERAAVVEHALEGSLSLQGYQRAEERVGRATRWLRWSSDLYCAALLAGLPMAFALWGTERGLLLSLPALAVLHLSTLAAHVRAAARLRPGRVGALLESTLAAAVYPPLLLRALADLRMREISSFHPAVVAGAVLPDEQGAAFLRAEIVRAAARAEAAVAGGLGLDALELRALRRLAAELGQSPETLLAPPTRRDPLAQSYCPACLCEYRSAAGTCTECGLDLLRWDAPG